MEKAVRGSSPEIVSAGRRDFIFASRARHSENPQKTWSSPPSNYWFELADETGMTIMYSSGGGDNFNWSARASIMFRDRRWLRFLVRGTRKANAIMTAVDQAGNRVARYRLADKRKALFGLSSSVEIAVNPGWKLTDELALAHLRPGRRSHPLPNRTPRPFRFQAGHNSSRQVQ